MSARKEAKRRQIPFLSCWYSLDSRVTRRGATTAALLRVLDLAPFPKGRDRIASGTLQTRAMASTSQMPRASSRCAFCYLCLITCKDRGKYCCLDIDACCLPSNGDSHHCRVPLGQLDRSASCLLMASRSSRGGPLIKQGASSEFRVHVGKRALCYSIMDDLLLNSNARAAIGSPTKRLYFE